MPIRLRSGLISSSACPDIPAAAIKSPVGENFFNIGMSCNSFHITHSRKKPVSGLEALAFLLAPAGPDKYAIRPASTASLNAKAISAQFSAVAMAVFTRTASAPISIASAACEGRPKSGVNHYRDIRLLDNNFKGSTSFQSLIGTDGTCQAALPSLCPHLRVFFAKIGSAFI